MTVTTFQNRRAAGKTLAQALHAFTLQKPIVLAFELGGVPIAYEIAVALQIRFGMLAIQELTVPNNPEFGLGAIGTYDVTIVNSVAEESYDVSERELEKILTTERNHLQQKQILYKVNNSSSDSFETVIIVDDGFASAVFIRAAIESARKQYNPKEVIFAAPICARDTEMYIREHADRVVYLSEPDDLIDIDLWYDETESSLDQQALALLDQTNIF